jgi:predicted RNA binding protein YcfA (HicA-like mRNA interferase family)
MTGGEFERRIKALGRERRVRVSFDRGHGKKGSHGRLYYGDRFTTLKDRKKEIGPGLLKAMLDQLGLTKEDLGR